MRPLHDMVLQTELCRISTALYIIRRCGIMPSQVVEMQTDSVLVEPPTKRRKICKERLSEVTFADLASLRDRMENRPRGQKRLQEIFPLPLGGSSNTVFRVSSRDSQLSCTQMPLLRGGVAPTLGKWNFLTEGQARAVVARGENLAICGKPGVGKSYFVRSLNLENATLVGPTHVSTDNLGPGAVTFARFTLERIQNGSFINSSLVCDEISFLTVDNWRDLCKLSYGQNRLILCGDFDQFLPVHSTWAGSVVTKSAQFSDCFRDLAGGNMLVLTENHRSEPTLFNFISNMPSQLSAAVKEARDRFPRKAGEVTHNLVLSHKRRVLINAQMNVARHDSIFVKAPPPEMRRSNAPQDMHIYPELELIGCCARKGILHNGGRYVVKEIGQKVLLSCEGGEIPLTPAEVVRDLRLSHAITYHSSQGSTLKGRIRLWDADHPRFTRRHLYVGISRATDAALVELV